METFHGWGRGVKGGSSSETVVQTILQRFSSSDPTLTFPYVPRSYLSPWLKPVRRFLSSRELASRRAVVRKASVSRSHNRVCPWKRKKRERIKRRVLADAIIAIIALIARRRPGGRRAQGNYVNYSREGELEIEPFGSTCVSASCVSAFPRSVTSKLTKVELKPDVRYQCLSIVRGFTLRQQHNSSFVRQNVRNEASSRSKRMLSCIFDLSVSTILQHDRWNISAHLDTLLDTWRDCAVWLPA